MSAGLGPAQEVVVRSSRCFVGVLFVFLFVSASVVPGRAADVPLTSVETVLACALPPSIDPPPAGALRVVGAQDTALRLLYGPRDLLVVDAGTSRNMKLGEQFFVRRTDWFGPAGSGQPRTVRTAGWVKIVAVNDTTSIATVEHSCTGIMQGDYLEPFVTPAVPPNFNRADTSGDLDFKDLGRIGFGERLRTNAGIGEFMLIDRGADQGADPGSRFAIYRDLHKDGLPLAAIGEAVVVSASPSLAVVRIQSARDTVVRGDFVVPRK
jgi:hypothetical protein